MTLHESKQSSGRRKGFVAGIVGIAGFLVLYIWDDLLFAAPIIAAVPFLGVVPTFVLFSLGLGGLNFIGGLLAVRAYDRFSRGDPSRIEAWLSKQATSRRGQWAEKLIRSGKALGFIASSFLLGGVVTTWIVRYLGRREHIKSVALASSAIFAVTFVGLYSGLGKLLLGR